ncbi:hypothetical protein D4Q76_02550 [archaeon]|nr:MAG: hypothetical protein D4Q76_02550 [archaeon]
MNWKEILVITVFLFVILPAFVFINNKWELIPFFGGFFSLMLIFSGKYNLISIPFQIFSLFLAYLIILIAKNSKMAISFSNRLNRLSFLKPDWRKVIIAIIIFLLFPVSKAEVNEGAVFCGGYDLSSTCNINYGITLFGSALIERISDNLIFILFDIWSRLIFRIVVFSYLFSCFIIFIYEKIKTRDKKDVRENRTFGES